LHRHTALELNRQFGRFYLLEGSCSHK
jgi:hypothetical protein